MRCWCWPGYWATGKCKNIERTWELLMMFLMLSHVISCYLILSHVYLGTCGTCGSARSPPRHVEWSWRMGEPQWDRPRPRKPWTKNRKSDLAMQCLVPWKFHGSPYCWICRNDKSYLFFLACTFCSTTGRLKESNRLNARSSLALSYICCHLN